MSECQIGFSSSTLELPIISWLIRFFQRSKYSHSFFKIYWRELGVWIVIDATSKGVRFRSWEEFSSENKVREIFHLNADQEHIRSLLIWGHSQLGHKYPMVEVFGNLVQIFVKYATFGLVKIHNPFGQGESKPRCNELVAMGLKTVFGYHIEEDLDDVDLNWLRDLLEEVTV